MQNCEFNNCCLEFRYKKSQLLDMPCNNASGFEDTTLPPAEEATTPEVPKMEVTEPEISKNLMESNESDEKLQLPSGLALLHGG